MGSGNMLRYDEFATLRLCNSIQVVVKKHAGIMYRLPASSKADDRRRASLLVEPFVILLDAAVKSVARNVRAGCVAGNNFPLRRRIAVHRIRYVTVIASNLTENAFQAAGLLCYTL